MKLSEDIRPITYLKTKSAKLVRDVTENRRPVVITQKGQARAVLMDVASYEELQNTLLMLRLVAHGASEVRAGRTVPLKTAFERVRQRLRKGR